MEYLREGQRDVPPNHESIGGTHDMSCLVYNLGGRIIQDATTDESFFVGIAGFTAMGKTTLAQRLRLWLPDSSTLSVDSFMLDRNRRKTLDLGGDDPRAIDFAELLKSVRILKKGHSIKVQEYNHAVGVHDKTLVINPARFVIIEGTSVLYPQIRDVFQLRVFLDADLSTRRSLTMYIETTERGYSPEEFEEHWESLYLKDDGLYIEPSKAYADIVCTVNSVRRYTSEVIKVCGCE